MGHHVWAWIMHATGSDNVSGPEYGFWSGFAGDVTLLFAILTAPFVQWKRNNCQTKGCWRFGRHPFEDAGVIRHLCYLHHPGVKHKQLTVRHLQEHHHLYLGSRPGRG